MNLRYTVGVMAVVLAVSVGGGIIPLGAQSPRTPTFNKDVAPIIFNGCVRCHRPNQVAPMSLMSYQEVRPWARAIKNKVLQREMPPWFADPRFGEFSNDPTLSAEQIRTITAWVDAGAPEGETPLTVEPPAANDGWTHPSGRDPDLVIEMAHAFNGPAEGQLPWFKIYQEIPEELQGKEYFVEAIQMLPGVLPAVHHMSFGISSLPPHMKVGTGPAWPGGMVIPGALLTIKGELAGEGDAESEQVTDIRSEFSYCCFVPGGSLRQYPDGAGQHLSFPGRGVISWSAHYTMIGEPFADKTKIGFWFQKNMSHEIEIGYGDDRNQIAAGREYVEGDGVHPPRMPGSMFNRYGTPRIPPNTANWPLTAIAPYPIGGTIYTVWPHMHVRGHEMTYVLTYPDGRERILMSNTNFDYNWQLFYELKEPVKVPAGSTIKTVGSFDNSAFNRFNPDPSKEVYWSEQAWDEMYNGYRDMSFDTSGERAPQVRVVGCADQTPDGAWRLTNATSATETSKPYATKAELIEAAKTALGRERYTLIGTADFLTKEELLKTQQRAEFTRPEVANPTGMLRVGRKLMVKGLLDPASDEKRLNLLAVQRLADTCQ